MLELKIVEFEVCILQPALHLPAEWFIERQSADDLDILIVGSRDELRSTYHPQHLGADPVVPFVSFVGHRGKSQKQCISYSIAAAE